MVCLLLLAFNSIQNSSQNSSGKINENSFQCIFIDLEVIDSETKDPIPNVRISLDGAAPIQVTNMDGKARVQFLTTNERISFECLNYITTEVRMNNKEFKSTKLQIQMEKRILHLD